MKRDRQDFITITYIKRYAGYTPLFVVYFVVEDFRDKLDRKNYNVYC